MNRKTLTAIVLVWAGSALAGAWDTGSFDNDDALDWVWELVESKDLSIVSGPLRNAVNQSDYLEAPDASMAIAAAEVVAALRGKPSQALPPEVSDWVQKHQIEVSDDLVSTAREAIERVKLIDSSELAQLWSESDELTAAWYASLADLQKRLE